MTNEIFQDLNVQNTINAKAIGADLLAALRDYFLPVGTVLKQRAGEQTPAQKYGGTWTVDTDYAGRTEVGSGTYDNKAFTFGDVGGRRYHMHLPASLTPLLAINPNDPRNILYRQTTTPGSWESNYNIDVTAVGPVVKGPVYYGLEMVGSTSAEELYQPYKISTYWKRTA